jgi:hypothetical protein
MADFHSLLHKSLTPGDFKLKHEKSNRLRSDSSMAYSRLGRSLRISFQMRRKALPPGDRIFRRARFGGLKPQKVIPQRQIGTTWYRYETSGAAGGARAQNFETRQSNVQPTGRGSNAATSRRVVGRDHVVDVLCDRMEPRFSSGFLKDWHKFCEEAGGHSQPQQRKMN